MKIILDNTVKKYLEKKKSNELTINVIGCSS